MKISKTIMLMLFVLAVACSSVKNDSLSRQKVQSNINTAKGTLFIIGGGKKSDELIQELIHCSDLTKDNYMMILPMASEEPDSAVYYASKEFRRLGIDANKIKSYNFTKENQSDAQIDSVEKAKLIYITGGDQNLFMKEVLGTRLQKAIQKSFENGSTIAGTSAGAAVMSKKMITGNQLNHKEYTGDFRTIEANNYEIKEGLGLLNNCIVDQHFIYRMRMNRLLTVSLENSSEKAIGIDESTAIIVKGDSAKVVGESQVIVIENYSKENLQNKRGLIGGKKLLVSIFLPGEKFKI